MLGEHSASSLSNMDWVTLLRPQFSNKKCAGKECKRTRARDLPAQIPKLNNVNENVCPRTARSVVF